MWLIAFNSTIAITPHKISYAYHQNLFSLSNAEQNFSQLWLWVQLLAACRNAADVALSYARRLR
jgi:hypothetical protein